MKKCLVIQKSRDWGEKSQDYKVIFNDSIHFFVVISCNTMEIKVKKK